MKDKRTDIADVVKTTQQGGVEHYATGLLQWFREHEKGRDVREVGEFSTPAEGRSSEIAMFNLHWDEDGRHCRKRFVLRAEPRETLLAPRVTDQCALSVELEYRIQRAVAGFSRCPIAPLVAFERDERYVGRPFYLMEFVEGRIAPTTRTMEDSFLVAATPQQRERFVRRCLDAIIEIHRIDFRAAGLQWLNSRGEADFTLRDSLEFQHRVTREALADREHPAFEAIWNWLAQQAPSRTHVGLSWGDARIGNIIVNEGLEPVALLDWEFASVGPTDLDLGWWLFNDVMMHELEGRQRLAGYPTREEQIAYYERSTGRTLENPLYWQLYQAMRTMYIFTRLHDRMQAAGMLPPGDTSLLYNNVATDFINRYQPKG